MALLIKPHTRTSSDSARVTPFSTEYHDDRQEPEVVITTSNNLAGFSDSKVVPNLKISATSRQYSNI